MFHEEARKFEELIPHISTRAPKADELSMEYAARQATMLFMQETQIFHDQVAFYGQRGVTDYILEIPDDQVIIDILPDGMSYNGRPYQAFRRDGNYNIVQMLGNVVDGGCYTVEYSYHIKPDACDIPDEVYDKHLQAIVDKALLLLYTGDPNTGVSQQVYQIAAMSYERALDTISARKLHNFSNGRPRMMRRSNRRFM